jgi:pyruvate/2-oxoglutarate dehydrogenase complex dihydrolipoamide acyltransferase (E2) component
MGMQDAEVVRWHKRVGDDVTAGEDLLEIAAAKVNEVIAAPVSGRVTRIAIPEGEIVEVGKVLAEIEESD